ncbi:MAG TPA: hypothetical protein H9707_07655 [Candidatus Butyricicoccus avicola]|nr:hypothetical protein [Candidatus Butyricicoccus avicola]
MFGKLMKYELKSLLKGLLPLYGAILAVALINAVMASFGIGNSIDGLPQVTAIMLYFGLCVAVAVVTFLVIIQRFYKGLLGQEGYLMFTLPVPTWQLTLSKLLGAVITTILSGIVGMLSILILGSLNINWTLDATLFVIELIVLMLVGVAAMILEIYVAMALGHLANKHRIAMSFVWFVVLQTVLSFLTGLAAMALGYSPFFPVFYANLSAHGMMWMMILPCLIEAAVFYFGTTWILKNKLNLE